MQMINVTSKGKLLYAHLIQQGTGVDFGVYNGVPSNLATSPMVSTSLICAYPSIPPVGVGRKSRVRRLN